MQPLSPKKKIVVKLAITGIVIWFTLYAIGQILAVKHRAIFIAFGITEMRGASKCVGVTVSEATCVGYNLWYGE